MPSYQYRKSHCGDKTILWPSYLHNRISYTGKTTSLYWIRALTSTMRFPLPTRQPPYQNNTVFTYILFWFIFIIHLFTNQCTVTRHKEEYLQESLTEMVTIGHIINKKETYPLSAESSRRFPTDGGNFGRSSRKWNSVHTQNHIKPYTTWDSKGNETAGYIFQMSWIT